MSANNCQVCSIRKTCDANSFYLFAPTPILFQRLQSVLQESKVEFSLHNRTFALHHKADRESLLQTLHATLSEPESQALRVTFDLANLMNSVSLSEAAQRAETSWFEQGLVNDSFVHWFQPIVNLDTREILGHECLIRLPRAEPEMSFYNGQEIIDCAVARGDLHVFDGYSRAAAIRSAAKQRGPGRFFINFTPSSIYDPATCLASTLHALKSTSLSPADIVFEVVESDRIANPSHLRKIVDYYRAVGFGVALDDVGTGSSSLEMIAHIQPDFIKLDKSIIWKRDTAIGLRMIRKLAELGSESGIAVIAEGVESAAMRDALFAIGIRLMQGYFFGKAAPVVRSCFPAIPVTA